MYRIIGADGAEYGPYSADDLRRFILERRADASTNVKPETGGEWRSLVEFPEFADALQAAAATAPGVLILPANSVQALRISEICGEAWSLFMRRPWLFIGASFLMWLIDASMNAIPVVGSIAAFILFGPLFGGPAWMAVKFARGQSVTMSDLFSGFGPRFVKLMLCGIIYQILIAIGFLCLVLPGIYLIVSWSFPLFLVMDGNLEAWEALEISRTTVGRRWWWFFGLLITSLGIMICGVLACGIGIFVAMPYITIIYAVTYTKLFPAVNPTP